MRRCSVSDGLPRVLTPGLAGRRQLRSASASLPTVVYYAKNTALIEALAAGRIDAVARGEIGNRAEARAHGEAFAVTTLDSRAETGGFALAAGDAALAACIDRHIDWLTDGGRIGIREWLDDPSVIMRRARQPAMGGAIAADLAFRPRIGIGPAILRASTNGCWRSPRLPER